MGEAKVGEGTKLRDAAREFQAGQKETASALTKELAAFAVRIAGRAA